MSRTLRLGISPCPNDVYTFFGLLAGRVRVRDVDLRIELRDVQALNEGLAAGGFDAAKASYYAALRMAEPPMALRAGSALGSGVGPVLLAGPRPPPPGAPVLAPGRATTAFMLLAAFHPELGPVEHRIFSGIMPALERGEASAGVCIHEGRFTYKQRGLRLIEDLGARYERETRMPLPLGGIFARREVPVPVVRALNAAIGESLDAARAFPEEALALMRTYAAELDDIAIQQHVDLYVNRHTRDLGGDGIAAIRAFEHLARERGLIPPDAPPLPVLHGDGA